MAFLSGPSNIHYINMCLHTYVFMCVCAHLCFTTIYNLPLLQKHFLNIFKHSCDICQVAKTAEESPNRFRERLLYREEHAPLYILISELQLEEYL